MSFFRFNRLSLSAQIACIAIGPVIAVAAITVVTLLIQRRRKSGSVSVATRGQGWSEANKPRPLVLRLCNRLNRRPLARKRQNAPACWLPIGLRNQNKRPSDKIARNFDLLCNRAESRAQTIPGDPLKRALELIDHDGGLHFSTDVHAQWKAANQTTPVVAPGKLPKLHLGDCWSDGGSSKSDEPTSTGLMVDEVCTT